MNIIRKTYNLKSLQIMVFNKLIQKPSVFQVFFLPKPAKHLNGRSVLGHQLNPTRRGNSTNWGLSVVVRIISTSFTVLKVQSLGKWANQGLVPSWYDGHPFCLTKQQEDLATVLTTTVTSTSRSWTLQNTLFLKLTNLALANLNRQVYSPLFSSQFLVRQGLAHASLYKEVRAQDIVIALIQVLDHLKWDKVYLHGSSYRAWFLT